MATGANALFARGQRSDAGLQTPARRVLVPLDVQALTPLPGGTVHTLSGATMGTTWSVRLVGRRGLPLQAIERGIGQQLDNVVAQMSHWEPDSQLSAFNRAAAGSWLPLAPGFLAVLQAALQVAADSGGAFDPTVGALVNAWGFGAHQRHDEAGFQPPDIAAADAARSRGGWQHLPLDSRSARVYQSGSMQLDLSAIAKGHAVDCVASYLATQGVSAHLVEIGGELRGTGVKPDGQPWWVQLENPPQAQATALSDGPHPSASPSAGTARSASADPPNHRAPVDTIVALHGLSAATSGDYLRCFMHAGRRRPHSIDPRTGMPIEHGTASVTVLHRQCLMADALSTALTVLGPVHGMAWATQRGVAARFVVRNADGGFEELLTPACAALAQ